MAVWLSYQSSCERLRSLSSKSPKIDDPARTGDLQLRSYLKEQNAYHVVTNPGGPATGVPASRGRAPEFLDQR